MTFLIVICVFVFLAVSSTWLLVRSLDHRHVRRSAARRTQEERVLCDMERRLDDVRARSQDASDTLYRDLTMLKQQVVIARRARDEDNHDRH